MANTIKVKRSATQGAQPTTGQLDLGEIAINTYDGKMFIKKDNGTASIVEIGAGGGGSGISTLNTLTAATQTFATGTTGTDFAVSSSTSTHTFNLPDASTTARGVVTTGAQSITGTKTFTAATASDKGLIVKGAASQTANLLEVQNSSGTSLATVNNTGLCGVNESTLTAQLNVTSSAAATVGVRVRGAASQSANFIQTEDTGGTVTWQVVPQNALTYKGALIQLRSASNGANWMNIGMRNGSQYSANFGFSTGGGAFSTWIGSSAGQRFGDGNSGYNVGVGTQALFGAVGCSAQQSTAIGYQAGYNVSSGGDGTYVGAYAGNTVTTGIGNTCLGISTNGITTGNYNVLIGINTTGAATANNQIAIGQTAVSGGVNAVAIGTNANAAANSMNMRWGGASRLTGDSNGQLGINEGTPGAQLQVTSGAAARKGQIVKLAASASANAFEVQNSSGTAIFAVDQTGAISTIGSTGLVSKIQNGEYIWLGTTGGTAAAQTASATPALTAYAAGQKFRMKIGSGLGSTGSTATAHTLNVNSLGAKNIVNNEDGTNPTLGTWVAGAIMELIYDGTNFLIVNDPGGWLDYTPTLAVDAGSLSSVVNYKNMYRKRGKTVHVITYNTFTTNSVTGYFVYLPLPINASETNQFFTATTNRGGGRSSVAYIADVGRLAHYSDLSGTAWGSTAGCSINHEFTYRSV